MTCSPPRSLHRAAALGPAAAAPWRDRLGLSNHRVRGHRVEPAARPIDLPVDLGNPVRFTGGPDSAATALAPGTTRIGPRRPPSPATGAGGVFGVWSMRLRSYPVRGRRRHLRANLRLDRPRGP